MKKAVVIATVGMLAVAGCSTKGSAVVAPAPSSTGTASASAVSSVPASSQPADTAAPTTAPAATAAAGPYAPAPLDGLPIAGEGTWNAVDSVSGTPVLWTTTVHPLASVPTVVLSAAVIDQDKLTAALFNGTKLPGGGPWVNADRVGAAARGSLVLAFNGGFLFKHITGGYFTEGQDVKALAEGQATIGIRKDGHIVVGIYGKDMTNDGTWLSLRQDMPPMVLDGKNVMDNYPGTYWGNDFNNVDLNFRTALCARADGKLMYIAEGLVRARTLGDELARLGCRIGMELDINGHWPQLVWFSPTSRGKNGKLLDARMWKPERYITTSEKDFIAFFDPTTLPAGALYGM